MFPEFDNLPGAPRRTLVDGLLSRSTASHFGHSVMPGVVRRNGVTNVVGVLNDLPASTGLPAQARKPFTPADAARQKTIIANMNKDPAVIASRQRAQQNIGLPDPAFTMLGGLPAMAARNDLTNEQKQTFTDRRNARQKEMDLRQQRQFGRAQYREAAGGRGVMFDQQGGVDQVGTIATLLAHRATPTAVSINPLTGQRSFVNDNALTGVQLLQHHAALGEKRRQFDGGLIADLTRHADKQKELDRQFGLKELLAAHDRQAEDADLALRGRQLDANTLAALRQHRLGKRKMGIQDLLDQREMAIKEMSTQDLHDQGLYDRSVEPHRRALDLKKSMPSSLYESPYIQ